MDQKKILIVDGDKTASSNLKEILEKEGHLLFTASDSPEAMDIFEQNKPDICIIEISLPSPEVSGLALLKKIKEKDVTTRCIILTSADDKTKRKIAKDFGADAYFTKPMDKDVLLETLNIAIHAQRLLRDKDE